MIKEIKGDLLETEALVIVHGCNAQGVMGSGVALAIRKKYPISYIKYRDAYDKGDLKLGDIVIAKDYDKHKIIINLISQENYGRDKSIVYCNYNALEAGLKKVKEFLIQQKIKQVAMPKIGCGLANGKWEIIEPIIEEVLKDFEVLVYSL